MVSSIAHTLKGASDTLAVGFAAVVAVWAVSLVSGKRWSVVLSVCACFVPALLLPDYKYPLNGGEGLVGILTQPWIIAILTVLLAICTVCVVGGTCLCNPSPLILLLSSSSSTAPSTLPTQIAHMASKFRRCPEEYLVQSDVGVDFKVVGSGREPELAEVPTLVAEMRQAFAAGITRPLSARRAQLKALRRFFVENEAAILEALRQDLARPTFEGLYYDNLLPISEIDVRAASRLSPHIQPPFVSHSLAHTLLFSFPQHLLKNLDRLTALKPVGFNLLTFPSRQFLQEEPLGTALVISTWNYPLMLSLVPVCGAIAAGNNVILKPCNVSKVRASSSPLHPKLMS